MFDLLERIKTFLALSSRKRALDPEVQTINPKRPRLSSYMSDNLDDNSAGSSRPRCFKPTFGSIRPQHFYTATAKDVFLDISDDDDDVIRSMLRPRKLLLRPRLFDTDDDDVSFVRALEMPPRRRNEDILGPLAGIRPDIRSDIILERARRTLSKRPPNPVARHPRLISNDSVRLDEKLKYQEIIRKSAPNYAMRSNVDVASLQPKAIIDLTEKPSSSTIDLTKQESNAKEVQILSDSDDDLQVVSVKKGSIRRELESDPIFYTNWISDMVTNFKRNDLERKKRIEEQRITRDFFREQNDPTKQLKESLKRYMRITEAVEIIEDEPAIKEPAFVQLTDDQEAIVSQALVPRPPNQVMAEKFNLRITRQDLNTLFGLNWLNDEIINFYVNLLVDRSSQNPKLAKVHAMNTFFYPKLSSAGHASLRRWTKKVDIFEKDLLVVPVHLGVHWCMAIVDFRAKEVRYYDSMGGSNAKCMSVLLEYLRAESLDKKGQPYDTAAWKTTTMKNIPKQMNGSDCGVFSCVFAEFETRDAQMTFTQENMPYFRRKMVLEIVNQQLLS